MQEVVLILQESPKGNLGWPHISGEGSKSEPIEESKHRGTYLLSTLPTCP